MTSVKNQSELEAFEENPDPAVEPPCDEAPYSSMRDITANSRIEDIALQSIDYESTEFEFRIETKFKDLVEDIGKNGQQFPVVLRPVGESGRYQIVCGFRRCRAIRALGWPSVKSVIRFDLDDDAAFRLSFTENYRRRSLTALDKAHAVCLLRLKGKTDEEIRNIYGMSQRSLERSAYLSTIPDALKEAVQRERIQTTHCLILAHFHRHLSGELDLEKWIRKVEERKLTKEKLKSLLSSYCGKRSRPRAVIELLDGGGFRISPLVYNPKKTSMEMKKEIAIRLREALGLVETDLQREVAE